MNNKPPPPAPLPSRRNSAAMEEGNDTIEDMLSASGYDEEVLNASMDAERDVLGTTQTARSSIDDFSLASAIQGLNQAMLLLSIERRSAYEYAVRSNARVVELETPKERFLRHANYDFWSAAQCLAFYWQKRREIYGEDRYCLPLTISGNGPSALSTSAVDKIKSGFFTICRTPDQFNRAVILADRENLKEEDSPNVVSTRAESFFYWLHVLSESDTAVSNGFVAIIAQTAEVGSKSKKKPTGVFVDLMQSGALPIKIKAVHTVALKYPSVAQYCTSMLMQLSIIQRWKFLGFRLRAHYAEQKEQLMKDLHNYGLHAAHLPPRLGGTADFRVFLRERINTEKRLYGTLSPSTTTKPTKSNETNIESGERTKRKMADFRQWANEHLEKRRYVKLKAEVNLFVEEQKGLRTQQALLEAQLVCIKYLGEQYDEDRKQIIGLLAEFTGPMFSKGAPKISGEQELESFAESLFDTYLKLVGRSATGDWTFLTAPGLSSVQENISLQLQRYLLEEQTKLRGRKHNNSGKRIDGVESDNDQDLQQQMEILQSQVDTLRSENSSRKRKHDFLKSSLQFSTHFSDMFEDYRSKHRALLADTYMCALEVRGSNGKTNDELSDLATSLADRVLNNSTSFVGGKILNVAVTVVHSLFPSVPKRGTAPSQGSQQYGSDFRERMTASLEDKPFAVEYLMSLCHSGETAGGQKSFFLRNSAAAIDVRLLMKEETTIREDVARQDRRQSEYRQKRKKLLKRL